ncbi:ParB-like protein [Paraburkholderia sp. IW21]|uniref:ParB-like protein n=1 Tax=Paraburkholderia sp. IW21 TaxID=3242488 RepID=UPI003520195B
MKDVKLEDLRPTQFTHGEREVERKRKEYAALTGHALQMAIAEKPIPIVLGPKGAPFATDHHHVAMALHRAGIDRAPVVLLCDFSSMDPAGFWLELENRRWAHPYDAKGERQPFNTMPEHIHQTTDDENRSLAAFVRDAGGYEKTTVALEEFRWADFFRHHLPRLGGKDDKFDARVKRGVELAHSELALGLPGYRPR